MFLTSGFRPWLLFRDPSRLRLPYGYFSPYDVARERFTTDGGRSDRMPMHEEAQQPTETDKPGAGVIFDLDGVLADTAELHYRSWKQLADELGFQLTRAVNDRMRGRSREESMELFMSCCPRSVSCQEQQRLIDRKNGVYLKLVAQLTPADALPGTVELIAALRARGVRLAVASSSRNARLVCERLGLVEQLDALVDGAAVTRTKPNPALFLLAARRLGLPPSACVVVEDADSGVVAARAAGMRVVGIGPAARVGGADRVVAALAELRADELLELLET